MESIYNKLALYHYKNECAMTDTVFLPLSEVCNGTVSFGMKYVMSRSKILGLPRLFSR